MDARERFMRWAQENEGRILSCPPDQMVTATIDSKTGKFKNIEYEKNPFFDKKNNRDDNSNLIKEKIGDNSVDAKETRKKDTKMKKTESFSGDSETGSWKKQQVKKKKGKKFL